MLQRVIQGDPHHRSRFHDEKGNFVGVRELVRTPRHAVEAALRHASGVYPDKPWYCTPAIERIEGLLRPEWNVIEFGSGMSTAWYARRVGSLHSIEDNRDWYHRIRKQLEDEGLDVRYELRRHDADAYSELSDHPDASVDLAVVDGSFRPACVRSAVPKVKPGGWLYLDNSDMEYDNRWGGTVRPAEGLVLDAVRERNGTYEHFVGLAPGGISSTQGLLARL